MIPASSNRDWTEDFAHENGNYINNCRDCESSFFGHKRRRICKVCDAIPATPPAQSSGQNDMPLRTEPVFDHNGRITGHRLLDTFPPVGAQSSGQSLEAATALTAIYDLFGIGELARRPDTLMVCLRNTMRFAEMLHAIEREFFMVPGEPDEDYPDEDPGDECLVNCWGSTVPEYVEQFRAALASQPPAPQASAQPAVPEWPEMESLGDLDYAKDTPEDWDEDYRNIWQKLQVASRNISILRAYARQLRALAATMPSHPTVPEGANKYTHTFMVKCPNNDQIIRYELTIVSELTVMVETIAAAIDKLPVRGFHEDIADILAVALPGRQTLRAHHHGTDVETVRGGA